MDKKQYEHKLENQLNDWNQEYQILKDMVDHLDPKPNSDLALTMGYLNEKRSTAIDKLEKLKKSCDLEWKELQDEIDEAWTNLGIALKSLATRLKGKEDNV